MTCTQPRQEIPQVTDHQAGLLRAASRRLAQRANAAGLMRRLDAVLLLLYELSPRDVAHWLGESERTLQRWKKRFHEKGVEGLKHIRHSGRPPRVPANILHELFADLSRPPTAAGYPATEWRGRLVQQHLKTRYKIALSLRQAQRLLQKFRIRAQAAT